MIAPMKKRRIASTYGVAKRPRTATSASRFNLFNRRISSGPTRTGSLQSQVKSLQRVIAGILPEFKNATIDISQNNFTTAGTIQHISAIFQGVAENQRIGEDCFVKKIYLKAHIRDYTTSGATTQPSYYRLVLVRDKQQVNDTTPAISDVVSDTNPALSLPVIGFSERFEYLWVSPLLSNNCFINGNQLPTFEHVWTGNIRVGFNGANATDIQRNGIYLLLLNTDSSSLADLSGICRVSFTDV